MALGGIARGKNDRLARGMRVGALLPFVFFVFIALFFYFSLPVGAHWMVLLKNGTLPRMVSLSVLPNAVAFFLFIRQDRLLTARGVLAMTIAYAAVVFILNLAF